MTSARQQADVLVALLQREHDALAEFLSALADFDRRAAWLALGHASLFAFLVKGLGLSKGAAAYRKAAVELVQRFPEVLEHLRTGALCITTVFELAKVVTEENVSDVIPRFLGASRRDAKNVVAELAPVPAPERTVVTGVQAPELALSDPHAASGRLADLVRANSVSPPQVGPDAQWSHLAGTPASAVEPKTAELSRLHVTVPRRLLEKLATARDALSHSNPGASDAEVLDVGLDLVIERHRRRRGIGAKPRKKAAPICDAPSAAPPPPPKRSRHVPADVWRAVWERDGGRCQWPLQNGGICGSTRQLELDHVDGFALGGATTVERTRLLCRPHQDVHARALYGNDLMDRYTRAKGPRCSEPVAPYAARCRAAAGLLRWPGSPRRPSSRSRPCPAASRGRRASSGGSPAGRSR